MLITDNKSTFYSVLLGRGVYAFINVDNRVLRRRCFETTVFRAGRIGDYSRSYRRQYLLPDRLVTQVGNPKQVRENRRIIIIVRSAVNFFVCRLEC